MPILTVDSIRNAFVQAVGLNDPQHLRETLLIRQGSYCGRQLKLGGYSLLWFIEERQVKFFCPQRSILFTGQADAFVAAPPMISHSHSRAA